MPDVPFAFDPILEEGLTDQARGAASGVNRLYRTALTGEARGRIRRPTLFAIIAVALALNLPAIGLVALIALVLTDAVVDLE